MSLQMYNDLFLLYSQRLLFQVWIFSFKDRSVKAVIFGEQCQHAACRMLFYAGRCTYSRNAVSLDRLFCLAEHDPS
jgi:hypothetical protein